MKLDRKKSVIRNKQLKNTPSHYKLNIKIQMVILLINIISFKLGFTVVRILLIKLNIK